MNEPLILESSQLTDICNDFSYDICFKHYNVHDNLIVNSTISKNTSQANYSTTAML